MKKLLLATCACLITTQAVAQNSHYIRNMQSGWTLSGTVEIVDSSNNPTELTKDIDEGLQQKLWSTAFYNNKVVILADSDSVLAETYNVSPPDKNLTPGGNSMSKSVLSLLVGQAMCKGAIDISKPASDYSNELKGTSWGNATIRQLLMMSSGAYFAPDRLYGHRNKDMQKQMTHPIGSRQSEKVSAILKQHDQQYFKSGSRFMYSNADTMAVSLALKSATGKPIYELTQELWNEVGAEYKATWLVNSHNETMSYMGFAAKPEDWVRLGQYVNKKIKQDDCFGKYLQEATTTQIDYPEPYQNRDYGYFIWTKCAPANPDSFCFIGAFGQMLMMDPTYDTVLYVHSTAPKWGGVNHWGLYMWEATIGKKE